MRMLIFTLLFAGGLLSFTTYAQSNTPTNHWQLQAFRQVAPSGNRSMVVSSNVRVRSCPSRSCEILGSQPSGAEGTVVEGPVTADDLSWVRVDFRSGVDGWASERLLEYTSGGGSGSTIPAATRTVNVSNSSQLSSAMSNAQLGDHIVLANGSYSGFTISRSGQSGRPIVIRAANLHGAKFTGNVTISGSDVWIVGMDMGSRGITAKGENIRISRNYFKSSIGPAIFADKPSRNVEIDHNEHAGGTITSTSNNGASPIYLRHQCSEQSNHHVHHNYIHDGTGGDRISEAIMNGFGVVCNSDTKTPPDSGALIEYNLISNWGAGYCLRTKDGKVTFRFNTCIGGRNIQNRTGDNNKWIANWFENSGKAIMYGSNQEVIGNRLINTELAIPAGERYSHEPFVKGYNAPLNSIVAGNIGRLAIGTNGRKVPPKNNRIEAHQTANDCGQGTITCGEHTGTTFSATTNRSIPQAVKLTPSQVGPNAPTAPRL